jgi:hypothetical protein
MRKVLVLGLATVLGLGLASWAQALNGSWDTYIIVDPVGPTVSIESTLEVTYTVSGWSFTSATVIDNTGWTEQYFVVSGSLGAFSIGSELVFDPVLVLFDSWEVTGGLSLAGVTFDATFTLEPGVTGLIIEATGTAGTVDVGVVLTLGSGEGCDFDFSSVVVTVDFPFCCALVESAIAFNCLEGFDYVEFTVQDIALPGITWVTLEAVLTFTVDEKTLVITPAFDFGATACFDVYLSTPAAIFGTVTVDGLGIECEIGGVLFEGISWLNEQTADKDKPGLLQGTPYWEAYRISTTDDGCCGPFEFEITVYFDHGAELFDVAELDAAFDIQISTQFTFGMSIKYLMASGFDEWRLHFLVEW